MTSLSNQKRLAAEVLGVGESRIWLDPDKVTDVANAITREDVRGLIKDGTVKFSDKPRHQPQDGHAETMLSAKRAMKPGKGLVKEQRIPEALRSGCGCAGLSAEGLCASCGLTTRSIEPRIVACIGKRKVASIEL